MARLNDPAPSLDAVETLKRRFIRQNREIARVNSTQSIRIRNLETEISRLLAENLAIREQAINVAQKAQHARTSCSRCFQLAELKSQLEQKLAEINALVGKFDVLDKSRSTSSTIQRRLSGLDILGESGQNGASLGGAERPVRQALEGWMPPIVEGKHYPRKTLDADDLKATLKLDEEHLESPDVGPPPVAHLDVGEIGTCEGEHTEQEDVDEEAIALAPNLERRRKRRASGLLDNMSNSSERSLPKEPVVNVRGAAGAKRKLSVREDSEDTIARQIPSENFQFSRNRTTSTPRFQANDHSGKMTGPACERRQNDMSPRKVLQPKTTNSPTKAKRLTVEDKLAALKENVARQGEARRLLREKRVQATPSTTFRKSQNGNVESKKDISSEPNDLPPMTPANLDTFSPTSTEPSESRSNAPAPEIQAMASVEDIVGYPSRPSRRPRGAVSYAEPNLRDKMRRPTKELVPAVAEINRFHQRGSTAEADNDDDVAVTGENEAPDKIKPRTVIIKRETREAERDWKDLPAAETEAASPLVGKTCKPYGGQRPSEPDADRTSAFAADDLDPTLEPSVGNVNVPPKPSVDPSTDTNLDSALSKLSIFEGPSSSPSSPPPPNMDIVTERKTSTKSSSRRHSSNPAGLRRVAGDFTHLQQRPLPRVRDSKPDIPIRPSSAMGRSEAAATGRKMTRSDSLRNTEHRDWERDKSGATSSTHTDGVRRGERTMARRRSMMI